MKLAGPAKVALLLFAVLLAACGSDEAERPVDQVTVQLNWYHQSQFAGFYVAVEQGFYAEEGLEVALLPRSTVQLDVIERVTTGEADFGISPAAGLITSRALGGSAVSIAAVYRRHPLVFMTLSGSGIERPSDFPGHTIRTLSPTGRALLNAMLVHEGVDPGSVRVSEGGYDLAPFFAGEIDIWPGYMTNEVLSARQAGYDINVIMPSDYGVHFPGDTLITTEQLIERDPGLVLRFVRATLRGWEWAARHMEEAAGLALRYDPTLDAAQQTAQLHAGFPLILVDEHPIGWMPHEDWEEMAQMMLTYGLLDKPVPASDIYTTEFLRQIFGSDE